MSRYIDLDKQLVRLYLLNLTCEDVIKEFLLSAVTADVVEVVRCKDCKHSIEDKLFGGLWCQHPTEKHCERNADFYCGSGERREDE